MTRASDARPTRRVVSTRLDGDFVLEVGEHELTIRPKGCRRGGPAEVIVVYGLIYQRELVARAEEQRREKIRARRARKGGR